MDNLTNFQVNCMDKVIKLLDDYKEPYNKEINQVKYSGKDVLDVCISIRKDDIRIWIYDDEAQFRNEKDIDERFEYADYDDADSLIGCFVDSLSRYLKGPS